jgi:hypothetical protein
LIRAQPAADNPLANLGFHERLDLRPPASKFANGTFLALPVRDSAATESCPRASLSGVRGRGLQALIIGAFILLPVSGIACPQFLGQWRSSAELSSAFNDRHAVIESRAKELRDQIVGRSTVTYAADRVILETPGVDRVTIGGETFPWDGSPMLGTYERLGCTKDAVALKITYADAESILVLNFEGPDRYWVYEGTPTGTDNQHTREYFLREAEH